MINNWTLFGNQSSASSASGLGYIQDAFLDITDNANSQGSFTSSASNNPMGAFFGNDNLIKYGPKTYYIKDYKLIADRSKWVNNEPTYQIIWNEAVCPVVGYAFGDIDQPSGLVRKIGDGFGLTGVARRVAFIVRPNGVATATAQVVTDGANTTTIDFSGAAIPSSQSGYQTIQSYASNQTYAIHDFRLTALQVNTLSVVGVIVYFENSGANIDCFPGNTYYNKNLLNTTNGSTLALPAMGSSLGGRSFLYQNSNGTFTSGNNGSTMVQSVAIGSSGTNTLSLSTGTGSLYTKGDAVIVAGASTYIGYISNISTDVLTVGPTLAVATSNMIYRLWNSGPTFAINASLMTLKTTIDFSQIPFAGATTTGTSLPTSYISPDNRWAIWGQYVGVASTDGYQALNFKNTAAQSFFQVEGFFSAAEIEYCGSGTNTSTLMINGLSYWSQAANQTGTIKQTVFTNGGPQWNSFQMTATGMSGLGVRRINLYQVSSNVGQSFGGLAQMDTLASYFGVTNTNSSSLIGVPLSMGLYERRFADRLYFYGGVSSWIRGVTTSGYPLGVGHVAQSTSSVMRFDFYGQQYAIQGQRGSSYVFTIDGGSTTVIFNAPLDAGSLGFHSIVYTHKNGSSIISAVDYRRVNGEVECLANKNPIGVTTAPIKYISFDLMGSYASQGQAQTGALYEFVARDISVIGAQTYVVTAGSTGLSQVDIQYQSVSSGFTSIFFTPPSADYTLGNNFLSTNAVLNNYPYLIPAGSILRFDIQSAQIGGKGLLTRLFYQEL